MIWFLTLLLFLIIILHLKKRKVYLLKCRLHFKKARVGKIHFFKHPYGLTFIAGETIKEKIFLDHVLKCINFHAPITYSEIDLPLLKFLDLTLPVYVEDNISLCEAKILNKLKEQFNLVIVSENQKLIKLIKNELKNRENVYFFNKNNISKKLNENLNKININYPSEKLKKDLSPKGFNYIFNEKFSDFCIEKRYENNDVLIEIKHNKCFLSAYDVKITKKSNKKINNLEFNYIFDNLGLNYYLFKRLKNMVIAKNLLTNKSFYFFSTAIENIAYSRVIGLKYSNYPCINAVFPLKNFSFCYGNVKPTKNCFQENLKLLKDLFSIKIETEDKKFNYFFNTYLKQRIVIEGFIGEKVEGDREKIISGFKNKKLSAYQCYVSLRDLFFEEIDGRILFKENAGYKLKCFFDDLEKTIQVERGENPHLKIDDVTYHNARVVSMRAIEKARGDIQIVL